MPDFAGGFSAIGGGISDLFAASGYRSMAKAYDEAAGMEDVNAKLSEASTGIQKSMAQRSIYKALGGQRADVAGAGFKFSGSAIDLARDSTSQGALSLALIENQGAIEVQTHEIAAFNYRAQAQQARNAATGSTISGIVGLASGVLGLFSDRRLKHKIRQIGVDVEGIPVYEFSYLGSNDRWRGYMAQEVEQYDPEAVVSAVGFRGVSPSYQAERVDG